MNGSKRTSLAVIPKEVLELSLLLEAAPGAHMQPLHTQVRAEEDSRRGVGASQEMERRERKRFSCFLLRPKDKNKQTNQPKTTPLSFCLARDKNKEIKQTKSNLQKSRGKESILHRLCLEQYMEEGETFAMVSTQEIGDINLGLSHAAVGEINVPKVGLLDKKMHFFPLQNPYFMKYLFLRTFKSFKSISLPIV